MMTGDILEYQVSARTLGNGTSEVNARGYRFQFDSSPGRSDTLPGPAELLISAFAACVLKNVERFAEMMPFQFTDATIEVKAEREGPPPRISRIHYVLTITTNEPDRRVELLHRNIAKYGTIYNTLAATSAVSGEIVVRPRGETTM